MPSLGLIHTSVSSNGIKHTHEKCITLNNTCNCMYMSILNRSNKMTKIMCTYFLWPTHKSRCTWRSEPILFKASFFFPKWPCQCVTSTFFILQILLLIGTGVEESFERIGERLMDVFNTPLIIESQYNDTIEITKFQSSKRSCCQRWAFHKRICIR